MLTYDGLMALLTYEERLAYLVQSGSIFEPTFGGLRQLNQSFYSSAEWRQLRAQIIIRDNGMDMGLPGFPIEGRIYIHHIRPLTARSLTKNPLEALDPDNLISVSFDTHNRIHYGITAPPRSTIVERRPGDTKLW